MTNLQQGAQPRSQLLRNGLLIGLPVAAGVMVASLVALLGVFQPWDQLRRDQLQLDELRGMNERLPLLRGQRLRQLDQLKTVNGQRASLLRLIAGSGQISTFLAQLNREATATGVQLDVFEPLPDPVATAPAQGGNSSASPAPAAGDETKKTPPSDPLEADGLRRTILLLSARGRYPNLLVFMRRLERLSLLVAQSDLNLDLEAIPAQAQQQAANSPASQGQRIPLVVLKLNLALYSKGPGLTPASGRATAAAAPTPTPAPPEPPPPPQ
ncbi:hypothetical protein FQK07_01080 [Synechococcus sp. BSF8S]|uniref:hypothetical protein n=1 Tax=Synechococcales TaxID=1890424 RepID=UPI001625136D|nr:MULTISPECIES: hypothetical protein [unclassified Synechococcus]MBC1259876.1 hypothetical protein [Synechococcus sp. BSF8S]MBC1262701.1 hypothetical protein [Synechococcus sp. BSA11S]